MILAFTALFLGLIVLVWSADLFVDGAAATAGYLGMPPLLIGMVVVGFGTSAPEMLVSALSSFRGNPGIALGNAYGSNITNIALILGITALISPISVSSSILRKELPMLSLVTGLAAWQLWDGEISRLDGMVLLLFFGLVMVWSVVQGMGNRGDVLAEEVEGQRDERVSIGRSIIGLVLGLILLIGSSRSLVWGAVEIAQAFGVSDLIIGLTIVAIGTSLPELASSIAAARKGRHEIALGNVLGSNLFNTLAVVGIAGVIQPMSVGPEVLSRDVAVMASLTLSLFVMGYGFGSVGRINRMEGAVLLACYLGYTSYLIGTVMPI
ncbi:calcium/sodium antiporter [Dethiosulfovibrio salsuginis]|uniref:Cation:H+ antiporter n=1 Tax=Dethiosulfovibrio salsuginis TaxID=561720 RepID=A0A1X7JM91_9BACT|nr:calcium/sodium antiporter [Dethiosulfovibrio salsuginis]SMG28754.1 cation:H+ antiporter [Dethiosulfovibrio salsuginis]